MHVNPYQSPASNDDPARARPDAGPLVSGRVLEAMSKTRPYVVFMAVLSLLSAALAVVQGVSLRDIALVRMLVWLIGAGLYLGIGLTLWRYGSAINRLLHGGELAELEQALDAQASFWQLVGGLAMAGFVLVLLVVGVALLLEL